MARRASTGSILVVTLWVIIILAAVAVALGQYLSMEIRLVRYRMARAQARAWAYSGVVLAMQRLAQDASGPTGSYDWLGDVWAVPSTHGAGDAGAGTWAVALHGTGTDGRGDGDVRVTVADEERRLDLNAAAEPVIARLAADGEAARALVDYRDADTTGEYEGDAARQPPYAPKNAPMWQLEELREIPDVAQEAQQSLLRDGTVATGGAVNINTAAPEVLSAFVDEANPDAAALRRAIDAIVASRPGPDGLLGTDDDCKATLKEQAAIQLAACSGLAASGEGSAADLLWSLNAQWSVSSSAFRIIAVSHLVRPDISYRIEAIVKRGVSGALAVSWFGQPFQVLAWSER